MAYFVGLDAGGTNTRCWIGDSTRVLGSAETGTVKLMNVGETVATARLRELLESAAGDAGVSLSQVARTCLGLAGVSSPSTLAWAKATLGDVVAGELIVCGDEAIALDAAFGDRAGILVIAGTGSHVVGRCMDGRHVSAGGWGPVLGDEGSGTWIGLEAIRAGLRALDRGAHDVLLRAIQTHWGLTGLGELVGKGNLRQRPDFAELAQVVARCAAGGDSLANEVLQRAGKELAEQVLLVAGKMAAADPGSAPEVAFTGSVLAKNPQVLGAFQAMLAQALPDTPVHREAVKPLEGALWRARHGLRVAGDFAASEIGAHQTAL